MLPIRTEVKITNLLYQEALLKERQVSIDSERDLYHVLFDLSDTSQSRVWDTIDFYSRPACIEYSEQCAYDSIELDLEQYYSPETIENYFKTGDMWIHY